MSYLASGQASIADVNIMYLAASTVGEIVEAVLKVDLGEVFFGNRESLI
ncbi:MAG: hypothetical protein PVG95_09350 [Methyloceanibacter sp.]